MKVKVYFCSEPDAELWLKKDRLSQQAIETMYELVGEHEFKNLITIGKLWLKLDGSTAPFGLPLKERSHQTVAPGDIIQMSGATYMVMEVGVRKIDMRE
jgi:sorbitol-specific phosphotransferase system component IIA